MSLDELLQQRSGRLVQKSKYPGKTHKKSDAKFNRLDVKEADLEKHIVKRMKRGCGEVGVWPTMSGSTGTWVCDYLHQV